jgi:hypothetical protein
MTSRRFHRYRATTVPFSPERDKYSVRIQITNPGRVDDQKSSELKPESQPSLPHSEAEADLFSGEAGKSLLSNLMVLSILIAHGLCGWRNAGPFGKSQRSIRWHGYVR